MWMSVLLFAVGVVAGTINTIAGGGSLLTLPILMACGLGATQANATNRIGVLVQSLSATLVFSRHGQVDWRGAMWVMGPVVVGAILGAQLSVELPEPVLRATIGVVMVLVLASLWMNPKRWLVEVNEQVRLPSLWGWVGLFGVGLYAGFLQAGAGILFLMALVWGTGRDLVAANGLKALLVVGLTIPALALFAAQDLIHWPEGLTLAAGQVLGGVLGARSTVQWGPTFVRIVLLITVLSSVVGLIWTW